MHTRFSPPLFNILFGILLIFSCPVYGLELSELTRSERESLSLACDKRADKDLCYRKQLYALDRIGRSTIYPELHVDENRALKNGCEVDYSRGPALYVFCLKRTFNEWSSSTHVRLKRIDASIQRLLKQKCATEIEVGLLKFNRCMIKELPELVASSEPDTKPLKKQNSLQEAATSASVNSVTPEQLFRNLSPSIVFISSEHGSGSGVAITKYLILTNQHVIEGASTINVRVGKKRYYASVVTANSTKDTCTLRINGPNLTPIQSKRDFADLKVGETVYALGNPMGLEKTFSDGIISGKRRIEGNRLIQITAPISPGSSGGGLFDREGNLIGITVGGIEDVGNLNFAIPIDTFRQN